MADSTKMIHFKCQFLTSFIKVLLCLGLQSNFFIENTKLLFTFYIITHFLNSVALIFLKEGVSTFFFYS